MSETMPRLPEMHEQMLPEHATPEHNPAERRAESHAETNHESNQDRLSEISQSLKEAQSKADSSEKTKQILSASEQRHDDPIRYDTQGRQQNYKQQMKAIKPRLSKTEQVFSAAISNKAVDTVSEAAEKTIARPQALLWGGVCATLSTALLYLTAKYIGFHYNYLLSAIFFVGGYVLGLLIELGYRLMHGPSQPV